MKTKCQRVVSHVFSMTLNVNVNWPWSVTPLTKVRAWESHILRLTFRPQNEGWGKLGRVQEEDVTSTASLMEENGPTNDGREEGGNIGKL